MSFIPCEELFLYTERSRKYMMSQLMGHVTRDMIDQRETQAMTAKDQSGVDQVDISD